jgi:hypothetical protein
MQLAPNHDIVLLRGHNASSVVEQSELTVEGTVKATVKGAYRVSLRFVSL